MSHIQHLVEITHRVVGSSTTGSHRFFAAEDERLASARIQGQLDLVKLRSGLSGGSQINKTVVTRH
jgi:hypothetical protein